jgi:hypothetical protein
LYHGISGDFSVGIKRKTFASISCLISRRKNNEKTSLNWIGGRGTGFRSRAAF